MSKALSNLVSKEIIATPEQVEDATHEERVEFVNNAHALVLAAHQSAVERAMEMGRLLIAVKGIQSHGLFTRWINDNTNFSIRTAQRYMKLATEVPKLGKAEASRVSHLSLRDGLAAVQKTTDDALKVRQPDRVKVLNRAIKNDQSINRESEEGQRRHAAKVWKEHNSVPDAATCLPPEGTPGVNYGTKTSAGPAPEQKVVEQVDGEWEVVEDGGDEKSVASSPKAHKPTRPHTTDIPKKTAIDLPHDPHAAARTLLEFFNDGDFIVTLIGDLKAATAQPRPKQKGVQRIVEVNADSSLDDVLDRLDEIASHPNSMIVTAELRGVAKRIREITGGAA